MSVEVRFVGLVAIALTYIPSGARADFFADFSKGKVQADFPIKTVGCDNNPHYKGSYRLLSPNKSYIEATISLENVPARATLVLKHLSSLAGGAKLKGQSPVSLAINGNLVVRDFDPGSHGYSKDEFNVTKYLRPGENTIRIQYGAGTTHYWIKWFMLELD